MTRTGRHVSILAAAAAAALIVSWSPRASAAPSPAVQDTQQEHDHGAAPAASGAPAQAGMTGMMDMMKMRDGMMARMKANDAQAKALIDKMNRATGDAKIAAMAELLTTLAEQRTVEQGSMMQMHEQMMSQMMGRMMMGTPAAPASAK